MSGQRATPRPATALRARSRLGKYRIDARLDRGAHVTVYAARDVLERRRVALKVPDVHAPEWVIERLHAEIRMAARLRHPNILPLRNADEIDGLLVAAYPLGVESLGSRLRRRLAVGKALDIFEQLLRALAHVHSRRVFHGDVKPDNIVLFDEGDARLTDFGLARVSPSTLRASGSGTVGYMAPEQAMGRPSLRSDVFAAGLVLYRMLAGELPEWPYRWPLPARAKLRRKLSPGRVAVLRRAVEVDHRRRFANAAAMLRAWNRT